MGMARQAHSHTVPQITRRATSHDRYSYGSSCHDLPWRREGSWGAAHGSRRRERRARRPHEDRPKHRQASHLPTTTQAPSRSAGPPTATHTPLRKRRQRRFEAFAPYKDPRGRPRLIPWRLAPWRLIPWPTAPWRTGPRRLAPGHFRSWALQILVSSPYGSALLTSISVSTVVVADAESMAMAAFVAVTGTALTIVDWARLA